MITELSPYALYAPQVMAAEELLDSCPSTPAGITAEAVAASALVAALRTPSRAPSSAPSSAWEGGAPTQSGAGAESLGISGAGPGSGQWLGSADQSTHSTAVGYGQPTRSGARGSSQWPGSAVQPTQSGAGGSNQWPGSTGLPTKSGAGRRSQWPGSIGLPTQSEVGGSGHWPGSAGQPTQSAAEGNGQLQNGAGWADVPDLWPGQGGEDTRIHRALQRLWERKGQGAAGEAEEGSPAAALPGDAGQHPPRWAGEDGQWGSGLGWGSEEQRGAEEQQAALEVWREPSGCSSSASLPFYSAQGSRLPSENPSARVTAVPWQQLYSAHSSVVPSVPTYARATTASTLSGASTVPLQSPAHSPGPSALLPLAHPRPGQAEIRPHAAHVAHAPRVSATALPDHGGFHPSQVPKTEPPHAAHAAHAATQLVHPTAAAESSAPPSLGPMVTALALAFSKAGLLGNRPAAAPSTYFAAHATTATLQAHAAHEAHAAHAAPNESGESKRPSVAGIPADPCASASAPAPALAPPLGAAQWGIFVPAGVTRSSGSPGDSKASRGVTGGSGLGRVVGTGMQGDGLGVWRTARRTTLDTLDSQPSFLDLGMAPVGAPLASSASAASSAGGSFLPVACLPQQRPPHTQRRPLTSFGGAAISQAAVPHPSTVPTPFTQAALSKAPAPSSAGGRFKTAPSLNSSRGGAAPHTLSPQLSPDATDGVGPSMLWSQAAEAEEGGGSLGLASVPSLTASIVSELLNLQVGQREEGTLSEGEQGCK